MSNYNISHSSDSDDRPPVILDQVCLEPGSQGNRDPVLAHCHIHGD